MDTTINLRLSKPDYENIGDIEVLNGNADIIDELFDGSHVVMSVNGVKPVEGNAEIDLGVTSVNGMTGDVTIMERSVKQLIDIIYPVGSYYDTSDKNFNPNASWVGTTWEKITDGRALIAGGGTYNIGTNYGAVTHKLTIAELPVHSHSASVSTNGNHAHERGTMNITGWVENEYLTDEWGDSNFKSDGAFSWTKSSLNRNTDSGSSGAGGRLNFNAANKWTGKTSYNGDHIHTVTIGNTGSNISFNILQPSTAVARWHRIA